MKACQNSTFILIFLFFSNLHSFAQNNLYNLGYNALNYSAPSVLNSKSFAKIEGESTICYIDVSKKFKSLTYNGQSFVLSSLPIYLPSPIPPHSSTYLASQGTGSLKKLFFVDINENIQSLWWNSSTNKWHNDILNVNAQKARTNTRIIALDGLIFYISNTNKIHFFAWESMSQTWNHDILISNSPTAHSSSDLTWSETEGLFYVDANRKIVNIYWDGPSQLWNYKYPNISAPKVYPNSKLEALNDQVFFVAEDNSVNALWKSGSSWNSNVLNYDAPLANGISYLERVDNSLLYLNNNSKLTALYWDRCSWQYFENIQSNVTIHSHSKLISPYHGKVFNVDDNLLVSHYYGTTQPLQDFVYLKGKNFILNNQDFFPVVCNYTMDIIKDGQSYWFERHRLYENPGYVCLSDCDIKIRNHLKLMVENGFNTVRINPLELHIDHEDPELRFGMLDIENNTEFGDGINPGLNEELINTMISLTKDFLEMAEEEGIKVILLIGGRDMLNPSLQPAVIDYFQTVASELKSYPSLLAYDFVNEPSIGKDPTYYTKSDICSTVHGWNEAIKSHDPNHLTTINLWHDGGYTKWDSDMLSVDFISFHIYTFEQTFANRMIEYQTYMSWIKESVTKPWIIGETGFMAHPNIGYPNDDGSPQDQKNFVDQTAQAVINCDGIGYSWWEFHDRSGPDSWFGLFYGNNDSPKPSVSSFPLINFNGKQCFSCSKPEEYYTIFQPDEYLYTLKGTVLDISNNEPVENAIVIGYNNFDYQSRTYTDANGNFSLSSTSLIDHIDVSYIFYDQINFYFSSNDVYNTGLNERTFIEPIYLPQLTSCSQGYYKKGNNDSVEGFKSQTNTPEQYFELFPNPTNSTKIAISSSTLGKKEYYILSVDGKILKKIEDSNNEIDVDISFLKPGLYFVKLKSETNNLTKRLIIH